VRELPSERIEGIRQAIEDAGSTNSFDIQYMTAVAMWLDEFHHGKALPRNVQGYLRKRRGNSMETEIKQRTSDDATPIVQFGMSGANEWTFGYDDNQILLLAGGRILANGRLCKTPEQVIDAFGAWLAQARRDAGMEP
jgi:hypothetical protein